MYITGRNKPTETLNGITFLKQDLNSAEPEVFFMPKEKINTLIMCAGFYQEGRLSELSFQDTFNMIKVGLGSQISFIQFLIKEHQKSLDELVVITSTSQFTPRKMEPVYTAVKAGMAMFVQSLSLDTETFKKVLVAAPSGMQTPFWKYKNESFHSFLNPEFVAEQILETLESYDSGFKFVKILRSPIRVEIQDTL